MDGFVCAAESTRQSRSPPVRFSRFSQILIFEEDEVISNSTKTVKIFVVIRDGEDDDAQRIPKLEQRLRRTITKSHQATDGDFRTCVSHVAHREGITQKSFSAADLERHASGKRGPYPAPTSNPADVPWVGCPRGSHQPVSALYLQAMREIFDTTVQHEQRYARANHHPFQPASELVNVIWENAEKAKDLTQAILLRKEGRQSSCRAAMFQQAIAEARRDGDWSEVRLKKQVIWESCATVQEVKLLVMMLREFEHFLESIDQERTLRANIVSAFGKTEFALQGIA